LPDVAAIGHFGAVRGIGVGGLTHEPARSKQRQNSLRRKKLQLYMMLGGQEEAEGSAIAAGRFSALSLALGELTASIAHEVNQPLAGVITNGEACLRWLRIDPPNLEEARDAVARIIRDGNRASEVIRRLRALTKKSDQQKTRLDINDVVSDVVALVQREVLSHLNMMMNGIEAMASVTDRPRELVIRSRQHDADHVLVAVQDSGTGIDPDNMDRLFNAFFTTKSDGMGMGLSICRSIIEGHGGEMWVSPNDGPGATFSFTVQSQQEAAEHEAAQQGAAE
jgi:signal transduction histidine kinase